MVVNAAEGDPGCYSRSSGPRVPLLTKDLKVAIECTVSGVIFSEFQGAMTRSQKKCLRTLV